MIPTLTMRKSKFYAELVLPNVIQIRMTERELELKQVPVSFFVKKIAENG